MIIVKSHPAWVCGLKHDTAYIEKEKEGHTLRGCVDWNYGWCYEFYGISSHTLRGCVDWNCIILTKSDKDTVTPCVGVWIETLLKRENLSWAGSHTLRGCVDWNRCKMIKWWCPERHTLRGCVDWNTFDYLEEIPAHGHTLRGCIWIEALFTRWSSLWKDCKHSASCVFLFKLL